MIFLDYALMVWIAVPFIAYLCVRWREIAGVLLGLLKIAGVLLGLILAFSIFGFLGSIWTFVFLYVLISDLNLRKAEIEYSAKMEQRYKEEDARMKQCEKELDEFLKITTK